MKILLIIFLSFIYFNDGLAANWRKIKVKGGTVGTAGTALKDSQCPPNYIFVPKLAPYTAVNFCVMKYEAKDDSYGAAVSVAAGDPWSALTWPEARAKCQSIGSGYDLISNDQWQTIARNIAGIGANWSTGTVGSGMINTGNSWGERDEFDSVIEFGIAASTNDDDPCFGITGAGPCSGSIWNARRRTHVLSNGFKIWDFSGNSCEWVTNDFKNSGDEGYLSSITGGDIRQTRYGADSSTVCSSPGVGNEYCGMGYGFFAKTGADGIIRGGDAGDQILAGIFAADFFDKKFTEQGFITFRCVYAP